MPGTTERRLRLWERVALTLSGVLGVAAAVWAFASRELTDFLGEGPVRALALSDGAQQTTIALGTLVAAAAWTAAGWARLPLWRYGLGAGAVLVALALAPPLMVAVASMFALAALFATLGALPAERRAALTPARHPRLWAGGSVVALGGLVVAGVVSVWLLRPLFDEGKELDEALAFELPAATATVAAPVAASATATGVPSTPPAASTAVAPAAGATTAAAGGGAPNAAPTSPAVAATPAATATQAALAATPVTTPAPAVTPAPASNAAAVLARGTLRGTDSFHFGSGSVLLVRGPDGQLVLRFEGYEVRNGPDLFVYLSPDAEGDPEARGALNLGGIKATRGNVNYEVPAGTDVSSFRSAVIWCRSFDVVFAVATFE